MTEYTHLPPEIQSDLAELTLNAMRRRLREAYDYATLLCDLTRQSVERRLGIDAGGEEAVGDPQYDEVLVLWSALGTAMAKADQWRWAEQETKAA